MFLEQRGPCAPQTEASIAECSSEEMGLLLLEVHYVVFFFFCRTPLLSPESYTSSQSILPALSPHSSAICAYACPLACVSHRSLLRGRQPSWGDAWVPPVNYTAFIWPDEWLAALSVPLPAISSGSPEPRAACSSGRSPQQSSPSASHKHNPEPRRTEAHNYPQIILFHWMYSSETTRT